MAADDAGRVEALMRDALAAGVFTGAAWAFGTLAHGTRGACGRLRGDTDAGSDTGNDSATGSDTCSDSATGSDTGSDSATDSDTGNATMPAPVTVETPFDVASLTKILSTWALVGFLLRQRRLALDTTLDRLLPGMDGAELAKITVLQLLTHTAGLPLRAQLRALYGEDRAAIRHGVLHAPLLRPAGTAVEYTDRAALILGFVIEQLLAMPLAQAAATLVWRPLGMDATRYGPLPQQARTTAAATEISEETGVRWQGVVHDYSARLLGGACGSAGVFSSAADLELFMRHLLALTNGAPAPASGFDADWLRQSLRVRTGELSPQRGLFWHPAAGTIPGAMPGDDIWCHHGFTGTSLFLSPAQGRYAVLLTNKVYFTRETAAINALRRAFLGAVFCADIQ